MYHSPSLIYSPLAPDADQDPALLADAQVNSQAVSGWEWLADAKNAVFYNVYLRYVLATWFSIGKISQAAGQVDLGVQNFLDQYDPDNRVLNEALELSLVANNGYINLLIRAAKLFEYVLLPQVHCVKAIPTAFHLDCSAKKMYESPPDGAVPEAVGLSAKAQTGLNRLVDVLKTEHAQDELRLDWSAKKLYRIGGEGLALNEQQQAMVDQLAEQMAAEIAATYNPNYCHSGYLIDLSSHNLYRLTAEGKSLTAMVLEPTGQNLLQKLAQELKSFAPDWGQEKTIKTVTYALRGRHFQQLLSALNHQQRVHENWVWQAQLAYQLCYRMCQLSLLFSMMSAYLSGVTLAKFVYEKTPPTWQNAAGVNVMVCAAVAYLSFNLQSMEASITNFCQSLHDGLTTGDYGIPVKTMRYTLATTIWGVLAGAGMAYFSAAKAVDVLQLNTNLPKGFEWAPNVIIYGNVVVSLFPSVFNFMAGCYAQFKKLLGEDMAGGHFHTVSPSSFAASLFIAQLCLDSLANTAGAFLGVDNLVHKLLAKILEACGVAYSPNVMFGIVLTLNLIASLSNTFLSFGMTMIGSNRAFQNLNTCCEKERDPLDLLESGEYPINLPLLVDDVNDTLPKQPAAPATSHENALPTTAVPIVRHSARRPSVVNSVGSPTDRVLQSNVLFATSH